MTVLTNLKVSFDVIANTGVTREKLLIVDIARVKGKRVN